MFSFLGFFFQKKLKGELALAYESYDGGILIVILIAIIILVILSHRKFSLSLFC